jgi:hypothetical protein
MNKARRRGWVWVSIAAVGTALVGLDVGSVVWGAASAPGGEAAATQRAPEMVENPDYASWARCKVGTSVTYKKVSTGALKMLGAGAVMVEVVLKDVTPETLTLEVRPWTMVQGQKTDLPGGSYTIPAKIEKSAYPWLPQPLPAKITNVQSGTETVVLEGKSYAGEKHEFDADDTGNDGMKLHGVIVTSGDVPNRMLRWQRTVSAPVQGEETLTLVTVNRQ